MYAFTVTAVVVFAILGAKAAVRAVRHHRAVTMCTSQNALYVTNPASALDREQLRCLRTVEAEGVALAAIAAGVLLSISSLLLGSVFPEAASIGKVLAIVTLLIAVFGVNYEDWLEKKETTL